MAITAAIRTNIIELNVLAGNGAPGTTGLGTLITEFDKSGIAGVAASITAAASWTAKFPSFQTPEEFGKEFLEMIVPGLSEAGMAEGISIISGLINSGSSQADVLSASSNFLSDASVTDASFGDYAAKFQNQTAVAEFHTVTQEKDTPLSLADVTSDAATVVAAKGDIDGSTVANAAAAAVTAAAAAAATAAAAAATAATTAYTEAAAATVTAIAAATTAEATVVTAKAASDAAATKAALTDATALTAVTTAATTADTAAQATLTAAATAYDTAIAGGVAATVSLANGTKLIAAAAAAVTATALATAKAASDAATADDTAATTAAATLATASTASNTASAAADAAAATQATAAAATADTSDDTVAATQVTAAAATNPTGNAIAAVAVAAAATTTSAAAATAANTAVTASATANTAASNALIGITSNSASATALVSANAAVTAAAAATTAVAAYTTAAAATADAADDTAAAALATTAATQATAAAASVTSATAEVAVDRKTFTLTTAAESITGTDVADQFVAIVTGANATGSTLLPGDIINGGGGDDTLTISTAGAAVQAIVAIQATSIENIRFNAYDTETTAAGTDIDLTLMGAVKTIGVLSGSATGDITVSGAKSMLDLSMANSAGDVIMAYPAGVTSALLGPQTQNITLSNVTGGKFTVANVETVNIDTGSLLKSTVTELQIDGASALNITGSVDLNTGTATNFKDAALAAAGAISGTVDASAFTGKLTFTSESDTMDIKGGTNNDTFKMVGTLNGFDKIDGGAGTDTITMTAAALSTQFTQVSNVEKVAFTSATAGVAFDVSKLPAGVTSISLDLTDAAEGTGAKLASTVTKADGMLVNLNKTVEDQADANDSDGTKLTITDTADTATNVANIKLSNIGRDLHSATDYFGIDEIDVATFETVNITANANASGTNSFNEVEALTATLAKTITATGTGALETTVSGTKVTSFDASALAGALTLTLGATKTAVKMGGKSSTVNFGGNLTNADSVIGGAGTGDKVTATMTGKTATTGALTLTGVEKLALTTSGANTLALAGVTGLKTLQVTDNKQTITGFDLATTIVMGVDADVSATSSEIDVTATDATGTDDTLKVQINAAIAPTTIIDATGIETLALTIGANATDTNELTTINLGTFDGTAVTLASGALTAGAVITAGAVALGTLKSSIVSLTSTNKGAVTANMSGAVTPVTFTGKGNAIQNITGGLKADTFDISSTGAITHAITGGASTGDTTNIAVTTGFVNAGSIDTENINITVAAAVDPSITTSFGTGVDNVVILGGNELSTLTTGTIVDEVKKVDASGFSGNIISVVAANKLDSTVAITGGPLLTDKVSVQLTADATYGPSTTGVEVIAVNNDATATLDVSGTTGLARVEVDAANSKVFTVSNITDQAVRITAAGGTGAVVEAKPIDASGAADAVTFQIKDAAAGVVAGFKLKATDVETVTIKSTTAESVDLSLLTMTSATKTVTLNLQTDTTFAGITLSATSAQTTTINGALAYGVTQTGRSATTAVNYTGSAGSDTFIMRTKGDTIAAGGNLDTLDVNYASVLGGISVNLNAAAGVNQISTMDGGAITGSVTGFENVDLAGYTGAGASITAYASATGVGSVITGTPALDSITGGTGADTVNASAGTDVINLGSGNDKFIFTEVAAVETVDGQGGTDSLVVAAGVTIANSVDLATYSNFHQVIANGPSTTAYNFSIHSGSDTDNPAMLTVDFSSDTTAAGNNVINLSAASAAYVITGGSGIDAITGSIGADTIRGGDGIDTLIGGSGVDTYIFEATGALNDLDVLAANVVVANDKLNFLNFFNVGASAGITPSLVSATAVEHNATGDIQFANKVVMLASADSSVGQIDTAGKVAALINPSSKALALTSGGKGVVVAGDNNTATAGAIIYFVDDTIDGTNGTVSAADVVPVASMTIDIDTILAANYVFS